MDEHTVEAAEAAVDKQQGSEDAVRLVSKQERLPLRIGSSTFWYRRMPSEVRNRLQNKHTKQGNTNWGKYMTDAMRWGVLGWENVLDMNDNQVPYDAILVEALPQATQLELQDAMGASIPEEVERTKNS